jgi:hypothetical protein
MDATNNEVKECSDADKDETPKKRRRATPLDESQANAEGDEGGT